MTRLGSMVAVLLLVACESTPAVDAGTDAGADAFVPWTGPGCDPVSGIECDGDWAGQCFPLCTETECCSPQEGTFRCVARGADGACPASNIWVDESKIDENQIAVEWRYFAEDDCSLVEGCVGAAGWRRLLRFGTWTPNTGTADLFLGVPRDDVEQFVYSACHDHYHFEGYAEYELRQSDGTVAATGHKQAFCLLDFYRYPEEDDRGAYYTCENQGIQRGWQDVYEADLDCQWVDVTDVDPGEYTLHIALNTNRALLESSYDDNEADVLVQIPADEPVDVTAACPLYRSGADRDCAWTREAMHACTAGQTVTVGCSAACGRGSCEGDTVLRACEAANDPTCTGRHALASNDDSGCDDEDTCSELTFPCPESGSFVVFTGGYDTDDTESSCTVAVTME